MTYLGNTDSGGYRRPAILDINTAALPSSPTPLPEEGFRGLETAWLPERVVNTAADAHRTTTGAIVGWRGVFTVRYAIIDAATRQQLANLLNRGEPLWFYPHSDVSGERYRCRVAASEGLFAQYGGRPIGYGPLSLTFETVSLRRNPPGSYTNAAQFTDETEEYESGDGVLHFASVSAEYEEGDAIGSFAGTEE